jgi:hypothetical protein
MGYFINTLQEGCEYELDGKHLQFMQKLDNRYYFYVCEYDEWSFRYIPTAMIVSYAIKELAFIKRVGESKKNIKLRRIGKEKVFPKI